MFVIDGRIEDVIEAKLSIEAAAEHLTPVSRLWNSSTDARLVQRHRIHSRSARTCATRRLTEGSDNQAHSVGYRHYHSFA